MRPKGEPDGEDASSRAPSLLSRTACEAEQCLLTEGDSGVGLVVVRTGDIGFKVIGTPRFNDRRPLAWPPSPTSPLAKFSTAVAHRRSRWMSSSTPAPWAASQSRPEP